MSRSNGEGTIYKDNKGYYRAQIVIGKKDNGKPIRKSFSGKNKKDVLAKMLDYRTNHGVGMLLTESQFTLQQWVKTWLFEFRANEIRPSTLERYEGIYRNYILETNLGRKKLTELRSIDIQKYYNKLLHNGSSVSIVKNLHKVLNACISNAVKQNFISRNYCNAVTLPKTIKKNEVIIFTKEEQSMLIKTIKDSTYKMLITLALGSGMRSGEMLALTWDDINFKNNTISIDKSLKLVYICKSSGLNSLQLLIQPPKTKASVRTIPIPSVIMDALKEYKSHQLNINCNNLVFSDAIGNYINPRTLSKRYTKILKDAKLPHKKFHALRHTYATRLFEAGVPIKTIQVLLGHANIKITMDIYTHVMPQEKTKAVEQLNTLFI